MPDLGSHVSVAAFRFTGPACRHADLDRRAPRGRENHPGQRTRRDAPGAAADPGSLDDPAVRRFAGRRQALRARRAAHLGRAAGPAAGDQRRARLRAMGRDERSALRWLARSAGAACQVAYLPVDKDVQLARIAHRQETAPYQTFPMSEADVDAWREQFQVPDAAELDGGEIPAPPAGWPSWPQWAADHWPSCTGS